MRHAPFNKHSRYHRPDDDNSRANSCILYKRRNARLYILHPITQISTVIVLYSPPARHRITNDSKKNTPYVTIYNLNYILHIGSLKTAFRKIGISGYCFLPSFGIRPARSSHQRTDARGPFGRKPRTEFQGRRVSSSRQAHRSCIGIRNAQAHDKETEKVCIHEGFPFGWMRGACDWPVATQMCIGKIRNRFRCVV